MVLRAPSIRLVALAALAGGVPAGAAAQVAAKSPFLPPAGAAPAAAAAATDAPIEFRGLMDMGGGVQFRLYEPAKKRGTWVKLNERDAEFEVVAKQHDAAAETLTVEHKGRTLTLAMRKPKVVSAGSVAQMLPPPPATAMPAPPSANVMPAVTQTVVLNPTPADEQRRLEAVAAEVARRRALREQATQQLHQGAPASQMMTPPGVRPSGPPPVQPR